jgi:hypothetical protein
MLVGVIRYQNNQFWSRRLSLSCSIHEIHALGGKVVVLRLITFHWTADRLIRGAAEVRRFGLIIRGFLARATTNIAVFEFVNAGHKSIIHIFRLTDSDVMILIAERDSHAVQVRC